LLGDPALRSDMGAAGQRRVGERFSLSRMVAEMEALYEELGDGA
jgi:glycosyltransferase involved in cell wall biosynthesis